MWIGIQEKHFLDLKKVPGKISYTSDQWLVDEVKNYLPHTWPLLKKFGIYFIAFPRMQAILS